MTAMHQDDAKFEADILIAATKIMSMQMPEDVVANVYALLEVAVRICPDEDLLRDAFEETCAQRIWDVT